MVMPERGREGEREREREGERERGREGGREGGRGSGRAGFHSVGNPLPCGVARCTEGEGERRGKEEEGKIYERERAIRELC